MCDTLPLPRYKHSSSTRLEAFVNIMPNLTRIILHVILFSQIAPDKIFVFAEVRQCACIVISTDIALYSIVGKHVHVSQSHDIVHFNNNIMIIVSL